MANIGQITYRIPNHLTGSYDTTPSNTNIDSEIVSGTWNQLGIQAPAGTYFIINGNKKIMMGRTGVYELDDISVTSLVFERPKKYQLNEAQTQIYLEKGKEAMEVAENNRATSLAELNNKYAAIGHTDMYWAEYVEIYQTYADAMEIANSDYLKGVNGIYDEVDNSEEELENIIIDYKY
jgi:hypothetical protein